MSNKIVYNFKSEIKQLLSLMVHSLYSNKEIFLRELISNASDAIDRLRFFMLSKDDNKNFDKFRIKIFFDKVNNTITVSDNGIGMLKDEIISNLGTIAKSGTKEFLKKLNVSGKKLDVNVIGQFGVGFYSSFIISKKVFVYTRSFHELNADNSIIWESDGVGKYSIDSVYKDSVGTDVVLHIKEDCKEFLDETVISNIIIKYSNHIGIPIKLKIFNKDTKKFLWKQINVSEALWVRNKSSISDEEYKNFYYSLTNNLGNPLIWVHNKVEGNQDYIYLFYIPDTSPWDIWNRDDYKIGVKLYVSRVFIMNDMRKIIPFYLRFIQGIIDSDSLLLNVSREILQDDFFIKKLRISIIRKILSMLEKLSLDLKKYNIFWKNFGFVFKEGLVEDEVNRYRIICLLRFNSSKFNDVTYIVSLSEYLERMKPGQDKIFYFTADSYLLANNSPHLEYYRNNDIEVLLLCDRVDEWIMTYLTDFKGIKFFSISKNEESSRVISVNKINEVIVPGLDSFGNLIIRIKNVLGDLVKQVRISKRIKKYPVILVTDINDISTQMSKLLSSTGKEVPVVKYVFEINIDHLLIKYINNIKDEVLFSKWVNFIYYQSLLIENSSLKNPVEFIDLVNDLMLSLFIK